MHPFTFVTATVLGAAGQPLPEHDRGGNRPFQLDRQYSGPIRPTLTTGVDFHVRQVAPSDHKPVVTSYELIDEASP